MKRIYAVLDIGSTTLKLLVAELMSTNINILFTKKLASHAIEGGLIKNEEVLVDEIRSIIHLLHLFFLAIMQGRIKLKVLQK